MIAREDNYINEAYIELERMSHSKEMQREYDARIAAIMEYNTVMEERFKKGKAEERQAIISEMRRMGVSEEIIQEILNNRKLH